MTYLSGGGILARMLPLIVLWGFGYGAAWYEETIIALGIVAGVVAELMVWRSAQGEISREIASLRADHAREVTRLSSEIEALRAHVDRALDLDRRLARLEIGSPEPDDEG